MELETLKTILSLFGEIATTTVGISFILLFVGRLIPNEKLYAFGYRVGAWLGAIGVLRLGAKWEVIETFLLDSGAQFLGGFRDGLNKDG